MKRKKVYICSPCGAPNKEGVRKNMLAARSYVNYVESTQKNVKAYAPHAYLPEMLDDNDEEERSIALHMCMELLSRCTEIYVFGNRISAGMKTEIRYAVENGIRVFVSDEIVQRQIEDEYHVKATLLSYNDDM